VKACETGGASVGKDTGLPATSNTGRASGRGRVMAV
jgi:hypothetical protein